MIFMMTVVPPLISLGDPVAAAMYGFVNPYASGYAWDAILCWVILTIWIVYERRAHKVKGGWICVLLGLVPGVAVGFGLYLILRTKQLNEKASHAD